MSTVEYRTYELPAYNVHEILRYAKAKTAEGLPIEECLDELRDTVGAVAFAEYDVRVSGNEINLGFATVTSSDLGKALGNADKVLAFAATVGFLPDKLIAKYGKLSPVKAVLIQAIAAERIEALCDLFCRERAEAYREHGRVLRPRFSPGYGDLSVELQKDLIQALNCQKLLGISLTESCLMMPSKSVTALSGICRT